MKDMTPETQGETPKSHICFFWKSKCHSQIKDMTPETQGEAPKSHICFFPEKVNEGRIAVGKREFSIGKNPNPSQIKFKGIETFET